MGMGGGSEKQNKNWSWNIVKELMRSRRRLGLNSVKLIMAKEQLHLLEVGILQCISPRP